MADADFARDILEQLARYGEISRAGAVSGWFAIRDLERKTKREVRAGELVCQSFASKRRVMTEAVATLEVWFASEEKVQELIARREERLSGSPRREIGSVTATASLPSAPKMLSPYVSDKQIEDEAINGAMAIVEYPTPADGWQALDRKLIDKGYSPTLVQEIKGRVAAYCRKAGITE